jgi:uncharacterized hydrophobic protein (TIGR00271 family)
MMHLEMELAEGTREQLYRSILDASHLDLEYVSMLAFAALIALFGLLQNSAAVIIGAMLISPLMNPILAAALALILGDWSLGRRAGSVLAWSIGGVIALTALVAWLTPLKQVTPEILARTNPNLLDLLVAVLAGLAGTLALRGGPVSMTIIPGVAIAVAVIPPLAVVGFSLSTRHGVMAWGGFLLFITNLVSILISAALVFWLMGFAPRERTEEGSAKLRKRMAVSALVLIVLALPLIQTLRNAVTQIGLRAEIRDIVDRAFKTTHSAVADLSYAPVGKTFQVNVTLRTTQYFETPQIEAAQEAVRKRLGPQAQLMVSQVLVAQGGLTAEQMARIKDFISGSIVQPAPKQEAFDLRATQQRITSYLQKQVDEVLLGTTISRIDSFQAEFGAIGPVILNLHLAGPEPLAVQTVELLASQVSMKVSSPIEIHGQIELQGSGYTFVVEVPDTQARLGRRDYLKLTEPIAMLIERPDLHLRASIGGEGLDSEAIKASRLWRDVYGVLNRSRLKVPQWSMEVTPVSTPILARATPSNPAPAVPTAKVPALPESRRTVRCDFRVYQVF